jgi:hypothetical protein
MSSRTSAPSTSSSSAENNNFSSKGGASPLANNKYEAEKAAELELHVKQSVDEMTSSLEAPIINKHEGLDTDDADEADADEDEDADEDDDDENDLHSMGEEYDDECLSGDEYSYGDDDDDSDDYSISDCIQEEIERQLTEEIDAALQREIDAQLDRAMEKCERELDQQFEEELNKNLSQNLQIAGRDDDDENHDEFDTDNHCTCSTRTTNERQDRERWAHGVASNKRGFIKAARHVSKGNTVKTGKDGEDDADVMHKLQSAAAKNEGRRSTTTSSMKRRTDDLAATRSTCSVEDVNKAIQSVIDRHTVPTCNKIQ